MLRDLVCLLGALMMLINPMAAQAAAVTVGDPHNPGALAQAVQDAYTGGARHITIRPGTYFLPNVGHTAFTLDGWKGATLSAYGVTLIITDVTFGHSVFSLNDCQKVTLAGPTLSQSQVTSYQGRVVAVGKDAAGKPYCDWRPDAGYPVPPAADKSGFLGGDVNVVDAHTRLLKVGVGDNYGVSYQAMGDGTFRAQMGGRFGAGDWLVGRYGDAPFKVYLGNCRDCTIKDVTMMRNGFAPLREDNGGGNRYLHCVWALGPRPAGAAEDSLVTNAADGMHMVGSYPGPHVEGCVFQGVFLDDCIAIHGGFTDVTAVNGNVVTVKASQWNVGDPIQLADNRGDYQEAKVTAISPAPGNQFSITLDKAATIRFIQSNQANNPAGDPIGSKATNPLRDGAGYKIIGCHLGNTRSRGMLLKGDDGLVKDNVVEGCGQAAISLGPEFDWNEAGYVHDVTVVGNVLRENGKCLYGGGALLIHGDGAVGNRNIVLKDNRMFSNYQGDFDAQWTDGITVTGNVFTGASVWPAGLPKHSPVALANCRAITFMGNVVRRPTSYQSTLVAVGDNVTGVRHNDDAVGIRTAAVPQSDKNAR